MDLDLSSANAPLERRIALLRELAGSLQRAQAAVLRSDIGQMTAQTLRQQKLCEELQPHAGRMSRPNAVPVAPMATPRPPVDALPLQPLSARQHSLLAELREAGKLVERLNRDYAALLRRARRIVDIFCRVLASSAVTYLPPAPQAQPPLQDSKG